MSIHRELEECCVGCESKLFLTAHSFNKTLKKCVKLIRLNPDNIVFVVAVIVLEKYLTSYYRSIQANSVFDKIETQDG